MDVAIVETDGAAIKIIAKTSAVNSRHYKSMWWQLPIIMSRIVKAVSLIAGGTAEAASANFTTSRAKAIDCYVSSYKIIELLLRLQLWQLWIIMAEIAKATYTDWWGHSCETDNHIHV